MPDRATHIANLRPPLDRLPDPLPIPVIERPFNLSIRPPGSKSITNRALLLAALADGTSELRGPLIDADDAQVMLAAIQQLGAKVVLTRGGTGSSSASDIASRDPRTPNTAPLDTLHITGTAGRWQIPDGQTLTLNLHNAGTATRFLTAAAILAPPGTSIIIDGDARMRERPIADLAAALEQLGVTVDYLGTKGCPPLRITPPADLTKLTRTVSFEDPKSSQFISAIMLIAPFLARQTTIQVRGPMVSEPYIAMSRDLLTRLILQQGGPRIPASIKHDTISFKIPTFPLKAFTLDIEPDASGATYFEAAAALTPNSRITIAGLDLGPKGSLQGDTQFVSVLTSAGATVERLNNALAISAPKHNLLPLIIALEDMPDTAMTAAVMACFAAPTSTNPNATSEIRGLRTLRVKETDRLAALKTELTKLGAHIQITKHGADEGLTITPPPPSSLRHSVTSPLFFDTYNDHRMAMSLALIGLRVPGVFIRNPQCVAKTYPTFWQDLARLYA